MANINELKARASVIKKELQEGRNTADRVGGLLCDMLDYDDSHFKDCESDITDLQELYIALTQSDLIITDTLPAEGQPNVIYRVPDTEHSPSQYYSDYMYRSTDLTTPVLMATYNNAIDETPTSGSNNLVKSGGVAASNIVFDSDISATSLTGMQEIKRWTGGFASGTHYFVRLSGAYFSGDNIALALRNGNDANIAVINSDKFNNFILEGTLSSQEEELKLILVGDSISAASGHVYAYIDNSIHRNFYVTDYIEEYADCLKEVYIENMSDTTDYYLFIRRITSGSGTKIHVQITDIQNPSSQEWETHLLGQASFVVEASPKTIMNITEMNNSGLSGTVVLDPNAIRGVGENDFVTRGHLINKATAGNVSMSPIIYNSRSSGGMYFQGLDMEQNYYLRVFCMRGTTYYVQLATAAAMTPENLVAQGTVVSPGIQRLEQMNNSGISGYVILNAVATMPAYLIDNETASDPNSSIDLKIALLESSIGKTITVNKAGGKDYTSLLEAVLYGAQLDNTTIYVEGGVYDLITEFTQYYGDSFFINYTSSSPKGIILQNKVKVIFAPTAKVVCNYTGSNNNVRHLFSPFNAGVRGFTLENLRLEASNCRYCIHDERSSSSDLYINRYINCDLKLDNRNNMGTGQGYIQCIGGGLGVCGEIEVRNCVFESLGQATGGEGIVSWHNSAAAGARSTLLICENYFKGEGGFRLSWYGSSTEITRATICGNSFGRAIQHSAETAGSTTENTEIIEWNNIVRTL